MDRRAGPLPDVAAFEVAGDPPVRLWAHSLGLACCAVEAAAALARLRAEQAAGAPGSGAAPQLGGEPDPVDVLVVAGTVTDRMAPAVVALHQRLAAAPSGCRVVSFGACASTGGPYWDSYSVTKGVDQLIPVDLYVPGCPPRPEALLDALARLTTRERV